MQTTQAPARLSLVSSPAASATLTSALPLLPEINLFRALANAETLYPTYMEVIRALFTALELSADLERMIVLRIAEKSDCYYAWRQNAVVAQSVGVTAEQIAALQAGDISSTCFSRAEQAALAFTDEVMDLIEATDRAYAAVRKHFSERAVTELLCVIGTYMFVVRRARTGRVPPDPAPAPSPQSTPDLVDDANLQLATAGRVTDQPTTSRGSS